jgi:serine protease inhibitor
MTSCWRWRTAAGPRSAVRSDSATSIPSSPTTAWGLHTRDLQGDPEGSRATINDWIAEQTRDRIPELLPEGFVDLRSVYVLLNTIYLKDGWQQIFGKYPTEPEPFTRPDGSTVEVDMMHNAELEGRYLIEDGLAVAELPYLGGQLAMRVLVLDDLTALEQRRDASEWGPIETALTSAVVDVSLPKWDIDIRIDLADPLLVDHRRVATLVGRRRSPGLIPSRCSSVPTSRSSSSPMVR